MILEKLELGAFASNCYILGCEQTKEGVIIDPGDDPDQALSAIEKNSLTIKYILHTHAHLDHAGAAAKVKKKLQAPIVLHRADEPVYQNMPTQAQMFGFQCETPPPIDKYIEDGEVIAFGNQKLTVIYTPGHSPGGVCFKLTGDSEALFSGDTLFCRSIGRTDLWGGDYDTLIRSIKEKIFVLDEGMKVYPGHGPDTSIGEEKRENPFLQ